MTVPEHADPDVDTPTEGGGWGVIHRALRGRVDAYGIAAYVALAWRVDGSGRCYIRHNRLAEEAGMSPRKLRSVLADLRSMGEVWWEPRLGADGSVVCNTYALVRLGAGPAPHAATPGTECSDPRHEAPTERTPVNDPPVTKSPLPPEPGALEAAAPPAGDGPSSEQVWTEFWKHYPKKVSKKDARLEWDRAVRRGIDPLVMLEGLGRQIGVLRDAHARGFCMDPRRWLHGERWTDEVADLAPAQPATRASQNAATLARATERVAGLGDWRAIE